MIKTEDIPHLENSTFSTRVVKDIAQNILSFLKSNCTKEGHTYWLFKGQENSFHVIDACCFYIWWCFSFWTHSEWEWHCEALRPDHSVWGSRGGEVPESLHSSCRSAALQVSVFECLSFPRPQKSQQSYSILNKPFHVWATFSVCGAGWPATWCWRRGKTESTTAQSELCSSTVSNSLIRRDILR